MTQAFLSLELSLPSPTEPPKAFRIFAAGHNRSIKGDYVFTAKSAEKVMAQSKEWGIRRSMDWEHRSLTAMSSGDGRAPAAAWYELEVRQSESGPELWAKDVEWTEQGKQDVLSKHYRYISPAFDHDAKTLEVTGYWNSGLTNLPATKNAKHLHSALGKGDPNEEENTMSKAALVALGLPETATEAEMLAKLHSLKDFRGAVMGQTGKTSESETMAALSAFRTSESRVAALSAELETVKVAQAKKEVEDLLSKGETDGKIAPGSPIRAWLSAQPADAIKAYLVAAPVIAPGKVKPVVRAESATSGDDTKPSELSREQLNAVKKISALFENKPEDVKKTWLSMLPEAVEAEK